MSSTRFEHREDCKRAASVGERDVRGKIGGVLSDPASVQRSRGVDWSKCVVGNGESVRRSSGRDGVGTLDGARSVFVISVRRLRARSVIGCGRSKEWGSSRSAAMSGGVGVRGGGLCEAIASSTSADGVRGMSESERNPFDACEAASIPGGGELRSPSDDGLPVPLTPNLLFCAGKLE